MKTGYNLNAALLAMTACAILSFIDNFVAEIAKQGGLWQFQLIRTLMALPLLFVGARCLGLSLAPKNTGALAMRSVMVSSGLMLYFAALGFLPVAQAAAGLFSAPIWVLLFSALLFSRRLGLVQIAATLGGFTGVLMVLGVSPVSLALATLVPLVAGAFYGLGMLITRYRCSSESPAAMAAGIFLVLGIFSLFALLYFSIWPVSDGQTSFVLRGYQEVSMSFYWLTLLQAVGSLVAISLIAQAYRIGDPAFVAVFEYSFIVFAAVWTFLLWGNLLTGPASIGVGLIVLCGAIVALADRRSRQKVN